MTTATVTLTETDRPSRSKQAGPCWIAVGDVYASPAGRTIPAEVGQRLTVTGKATIRRASRPTVERGTWTVEVTGDPADVVTVSLSSPQPITATISGAKEVQS